MPATPNRGQLINASNTGYAANVNSGGVVHAPASLDVHSGDLNTTANGQTFENLDITGYVKIRHENVTFRDCNFRKTAWIDPYELDFQRNGTQFLWCTFVVTNGFSPNQDNANAAIRLGGFTAYRCKIGGYEDLIHPWGGDIKIVECYLFSPFHFPNSKNHSFGDSHNDPFQPSIRDSTPKGFNSCLIQGCRFDTFWFEPGESVGSNFPVGDGMPAGSGPTTSGAFNLEFEAARNLTFRDNYVDGNYSQCMYNINSNDRPDGPPQNTVVIDNIFKRRRSFSATITDGRNFGSNGFCNFGRHSGAAGAVPTVKWGGTIGNLDAATGTKLAANYQGSPNGTIVQVDDSSQFASFFTGPDPDPPPPPPPPDTDLVVTTPADASVHTSGTVVFVGGADTGAGDSADNYTFFDYYLATADLGEIFLDHDRSTSNTGFTFSTITADGVTFTDRSGVQRTVLGEATLRIKGIRNDGSVPTGEVTVTFGDVTEDPPPTGVDIEIAIVSTLRGPVNIDTSTGGVDPQYVKRVKRRVPASFKDEWYFEDERNDREVVFVNGTPVYRGDA